MRKNEYVNYINMYSYIYTYVCMGVYIYFEMCIRILSLKVPNIQHLYLLKRTHNPYLNYLLYTVVDVHFTRLSVSQALISIAIQPLRGHYGESGTWLKTEH